MIIWGMPLYIFVIIVTLIVTILLYILEFYCKRPNNFVPITQGEVEAEQDNRTVLIVLPGVTGGIGRAGKNKPGNLGYRYKEDQQDGEQEQDKDTLEMTSYSKGDKKDSSEFKERIKESAKESCEQSTSGSSAFEANAPPPGTFGNLDSGYLGYSSGGGGDSARGDSAGDNIGGDFN